MKFVRHLLAVCGVIALIFGLSYAWSHSGAAGIVAHDHDRRPPSGAMTSMGDTDDDRPDHDDGPEGHDERERRRNGSGGFALSSIDDFGQTLVTMAVIGGIVIALDKARRRRSRQRPGNRSIAIPGR